MGERSGEDGLLAQAEIAPLTGLAESLGIDRSRWIQVATEPLPETLRLTMHHYDIEWTRKQLIAMGVGCEVGSMVCVIQVSSEVEVAV